MHKIMKSIHACLWIVLFLSYREKFDFKPNWFQQNDFLFNFRNFIVYESILEYIDPY